MAETVYLVDTSVLLNLIRGRELGRYIEQQYSVESSRIRPVISTVSLGEIWSLAEQNSWGKEKRQLLDKVLQTLVTVDISEPGVIDAYVELDVASLKHPAGARNMGKNDLWIAATAKVIDATLLTHDKDFDHLAAKHIHRIFIPLDSKPKH